MSAEREAVELVLPSGRFARIVRPNGQNLFFADNCFQHYCFANRMPLRTMIYHLAVFCVEIDGNAITWEEVMTMDARDVRAFAERLSFMMLEPVKQIPTLKGERQ